MLGERGAGRARHRRAVQEAQALGTGGASAGHGARHSAQGRDRDAATRQPGIATRPTGQPRHDHWALGRACSHLGLLAGLSLCALCT